MNVVGIESSCDETSVAVISDGRLKANLISSQHFHKDFGGVVPELSSRAHLQIIAPLLKQALEQSGINKESIDVVASTAGPGLIGAVLVGLTFAKGLSFSLNKPFVPVNHIEGHIYSGFLMEQKPEFPYLCLVVSGGHTLLLIVESETRIRKLGSTIDDAAGEAFDKTAKMLGLGYPGGIMIQQEAEKGNRDAIEFPISQCKNEFDFSFSGLKTAVLRYIQKEFGNRENISPDSIPDIAASFQKAAVDALFQKSHKALKKYKVNSISVVGGVAANKYLRNRFAELAEKYNKSLIIPDLQYCGDNGAMIALRGSQVYNSGQRFDLSYNAFASLPESVFIQ